MSFTFPSAKLAVDALADEIGTQLTLARTGSTIALWTHDFDEDQAANPYTVLRIYGGSIDQTAPMASALVQATTRGSVTTAAIERAEAIYQALHDSGGRPRRHWQLTGFVVSLRSLRRPAQIGRDDRGRVEIVSNFELVFYAANAA